MPARDANDLLWREVRGVLVVVHGREAPTDERWQELVTAASLPLPDGTRTPRPWAAVLIYSLGGMPTVTQRAKLGTLLTVKAPAPPIALSSDSHLARGVLTAVRWLFPALRSMRAFTLEQRSPALEWLGLDAETGEQVGAALTELLAALPQRSK
jgi:hypothetical protein